MNVYCQPALPEFVCAITAGLPEILTSMYLAQGGFRSDIVSILGVSVAPIIHVRGAPYNLYIYSRIDKHKGNL